MKKILFVLTAALALVACQKNDAVVNDALVSIPVSVEPMNTPTKASVVVDGTKFTPSLTDGDVFAVMSSYIGTTATKKFTYSKTDGTITGSLPTFDTDKERYIVVSSAVSSTGGISGIGANNNNWRITIDAAQNNTEGEFENDLLLVAVTDECESGVSPETIEFKTMCSLLEFDITNGVSDKTYLESITVEAVGGEQIAGKYALAKTYSDNWMESYTVDSNINAKDKSSSITVDCGKTELTAASAPFYVACAFGTLSQGLKVTFTLSYEDGSESQMVKTIGKSGLTLARNTLYQIPTVVSSRGSSLSFDSVEVSDVSNKGDVISLKYTVGNPIEGETISATSDASWINTFDYSTAGELSFVVDANEGVARTATVTVSYKSAAPVTITVSQLKADAANNEYTFTAGTDTGAGSVTKGDVTITMSTMDRTDNYRTNAKSNMVVSVPEGKNITKIILTCTGKGTNNYGPGLFSTTVGTYTASTTSNTGTWEGESQSVSFSASKQVRMTSIVVTYK